MRRGRLRDVERNATATILLRSAHRTPQGLGVFGVFGQKGKLISTALTPLYRGVSLFAQTPQTRVNFPKGEGRPPISNQEETRSSCIPHDTNRSREGTRDAEGVTGTSRE